ncbi:MAG: hypothetical protein M1814_005362 [Vezdaea aestivalis]|nr:MAG: hypothetical protein M1814_005362 [Vezdaea aestivalis]
MAPSPGVYVHHSAKASNSSGASSPRPMPLQVSSSLGLYTPYSYPEPQEILDIMTQTNGLMRGYLRFTVGKSQGWTSAYCFVDPASGSLLCDPEDKKASWVPRRIVADLRGCHVYVATSVQDGLPRLFLASASRGISLQARPLINEDVVQWFAALLCWRFTKPMGALNKSVATRSPCCQNSTHLTGEHPVVLSGKMLYTNQRSQSDTQHNGLAAVANYQVSCVLRDSGELSVHADTKAEPFMRLALPALQRHAIHALDTSVLNSSLSIAVYPQYSTNPNDSSLWGQPFYLTLSNRSLFETWLVVLRSYTAVDLYGPSNSPFSGGSTKLSSDPFVASKAGMFRVERKLSVRITEANIHSPHPIFNHHDQVHGRSPDRSLAAADYSLEVMLDQQLWARTPIKHKTNTPFWRETFEFSNLPSVISDLFIMVKRHNGHKRQVSQPIYDLPIDDEYHSVVELPDEMLLALHSGKEAEGWFPLVGRGKRKCGEISLWLRIEQVTILMVGDYSPLSDLLHDFTNRLTSRLATLFSADLQLLAQVLLDIFQASNSSRQWFMRLIEDDVDSGQRETQTRKKFNLGRRAGTNESFDSASERELVLRGMGKSAIAEGALLFRGNSILTKALDIHFKRIGGDYLQETLRVVIEEVERANLDCEVDPNRASAAANLELNWTNLMAITQRTWDAIKVSAKRCPYDLRFLMRYVRSNVEDRFGGFLQSVSYSSVSAFLFLRFLVPSILNPRLFNLLNHHPSPRVQRTLTLVSKTLQVLANLSTFGVKEPFMQPMNQFLSQNRQEFKSFIDEFCSVPTDPPSIPQPLSVTMAAASTAQLDPLTREYCLAVPYLLDQGKSFALLVELWLKSSENIDRTALDGDLFLFHHICVGLRQRTQDCISNAEAAALPSDDEVISWEELLESSNALSPPEAFLSVFDDDDGDESPASSSENFKVQDMAPDMEQLQIVDRNTRSSAPSSKKKLNTLVGGFRRKPK